MKRILGALIVLSLLVSCLTNAFPSVAAADPPYSGGSGTEDDPYLINSANDLYELRNNTLTNPSLYGAKKHYRLINDIKFSGSITPLHEMKCNGYACTVETEYSVEYIKALLNRYTAEEFEEWYSQKVATMGYFYKKCGSSCAEYRFYVEGTYPLYTASEVAEYVDWYYEEKPPRYSGVDYPTFYRSAAFTGVFDGNGHSIEINNNYLFGFLENGAVVKDLELLGSSASLAFKVDKTSEITNCIINSDTTNAEIYQVCRANDYDTFDIVGGAVAINYGTIQNCTNYAKGISGIVGDNRGIAINCINYGEVIPNGEGISYKDGISGWYGFESINSFLANRDKFIGENGLSISDRVYFPSSKGIYKGRFCIDYTTESNNLSGDGYFSAIECEAAAGNPEIYKSEGFDFETVWIMIDGIPTLRSTLEPGTGDVNLDGAVNSIDTNLLKRFIAGAGVNIEYAFPFAADMDSSSSIDAVDSALLKRMLVG